MYKLLAVVGLVACVSAKDLSVGHEGGKLIFNQNVTASPAIWRQVRNLTVNATDNEVITRVVVLDNREDKNGEAAIVEGGEGFNNVTVELKSPAVFRGYDFEVQVYAKSEDGTQMSVDQQQHNTQDHFDDKQVPKFTGYDVIKGIVTPVEPNTQDKVQHPIVNEKDDKQQVRPNRETGPTQVEQPIVPTDFGKDIVEPHVHQKDYLGPVEQESVTTDITVDEQTEQTDRPVIPVHEYVFPQITENQDGRSKVDITTPKVEIQQTTQKVEEQKVKA